MMLIRLGWQSKNDYAKKRYLKDWQELLVEAQVVLSQCVDEVSVKFLDAQHLCPMHLTLITRKPLSI